MGKLIAGIILEGISAFSQERRLAFQKKFRKVLDRVSHAENDLYPDYTDAALMIAKEEEDIFLQAYYIELKGHNKEIKGKLNA